jgi:hypothetical protein
MFWWSWSDVNVTGGGGVVCATAMPVVIEQIVKRRQIKAARLMRVTEMLRSVML